MLKFEKNMSLKINKNSILFRGEIYTVAWKQQNSTVEPSMGKILAGIKQNLEDLEKEEVITLDVEDEIVTVKQQKPSDRENFKQRLSRKKRKEVKL